MTYLPIHLVNEIKLGGPTHLRWMYSIETTLCHFKGIVRNKKNSELAIVEDFSAIDCLTFISRYLHDTVKTPFNRYQTESDEDNQIEEGNAPSLFPKTCHPIESMNKRKGKTFNVENHEMYGAHPYVLFNTGDEKVDTFIEKHKNLIYNRTRGNAWVNAQIRSREFSD
ncbi:uncharacterized protein LOC107031653 [Solanum pennellii]|uniref:Uncharacterized protein LOC107031653 n=1 Tax=Solanum pennellii TaxID=28526 RepID=A0ABM1HPQ5_SOLPN|nr:uncharacterized protein LOC107031653 [Solanum pennellii]